MQTVVEEILVGASRPGRAEIISIDRDELVVAMFESWAGTPRPKGLTYEDIEAHSPPDLIEALLAFAEGAIAYFAVALDAAVRDPAP